MLRQTRMVPLNVSGVRFEDCLSLLVLPTINSLRQSDECVSKLTIIDSDNGLSPGWHQAIIWTNAGILSIGLLGTNYNEILIEILTCSFKKRRLNVSSAKSRPFCLSLNVLIGACSMPAPVMLYLPLPASQYASETRVLILSDEWGFVYKEIFQLLVQTKCFDVLVSGCLPITS